MVLTLPRGNGGKGKIASAQWADRNYIGMQDCLVLKKSPSEFSGTGTLFLGYSDDSGDYVGLADDRHCLTVAGSRAGKGVSLIIPNLILYGGSVVCIDPKGENAKVTADRRRRMGHDVYVLDPFCVSKDTELASYNPFDDLDPTSETIIDDAAMLADSFILDRNLKDPHWDDSARDLIKGLILHIKLEKPFPDQHNFVTLRQTLTDPTKLDRALVAMSKGTTLDAVIAAAATTFAIKPDKERDSVLSTALRHTEFLDSPGMRKVLVGGKGMKPLPSLRTLRAAHREAGATPLTLFLCLPAGRMPTHARWLRVIVNFALALMEVDAQNDTAKPTGPAVLFLLDEFATLGHMPQLAVAAGLMAGFGVRIWPFLQDLSQLQHHYEKTWETFVGNAGAHTFFGNTDLTTLRHVSERLGKVRMISAGRSETKGAMPGSSSETISRSETTSPLLSTDEIQILFARRAAEDYLILLLPHSLPIAARKIAYYRDPHLRMLLDPLAAPVAPVKKKGLFW